MNSDSNTDWPWKWGRSCTDYVPTSGRFVDETGNKYGRLLALYPVVGKPNIGVIWVWKCDCGNIVKASAYDARRGHAVSCGCLRKHMNAGNWRGVGSIPGKLLSTIKRSARDRGHIYAVTSEYLWGLYEAQDGLCALSGLPITFKNLNVGTEQTASLDRIDSNEGYVEGNVQWVHKTINLMKNTLPQPEFINFCNSVSKHNSHA